MEEWTTTNRIANERAGALLAADPHVVVDDTGSPRFIRDEWRATASAAGAPFVLVWVQVSPELQRQRVLGPSQQSKAGAARCHGRGARRRRRELRGTGRGRPVSHRRDFYDRAMGRDYDGPPSSAWTPERPGRAQSCRTGRQHHAGGPFIHARFRRCEPA
ncbi:AAA family ATPase [Curtobacterium sp. MCBD17_040]|uniref:AAA family ATPase n=1 Tax=Curtobacterium sp. MCBD17_040 TaxID=2175674 RepID=UPI0015E8E917